LKTTKKAGLSAFFAFTSPKGLPAASTQSPTLFSFGNITKKEGIICNYEK
jgi:hypothetical protein